MRLALHLRPARQRRRLPRRRRRHPADRSRRTWSAWATPSREAPSRRRRSQRLMSLDCPTVLGNADAFLFGMDVAGGDDARAGRGARLDARADRRAGVEQLRSFQPIVETELEGQTVLCCHGSAPIVRRHSPARQRRRPRPVARRCGPARRRAHAPAVDTAHRRRALRQSRQPSALPTTTTGRRRTSGSRPWRNMRSSPRPDADRRSSFAASATTLGELRDVVLASGRPYA